MIWYPMIASGQLNFNNVTIITAETLMMTAIWGGGGGGGGGGG